MNEEKCWVSLHPREFAFIDDVVQRESTIRTKLPRLNELLSQIKEPDFPNAYSWANLVKDCLEEEYYGKSNSVLLKYCSIEKALQELDIRAWAVFKEKVRPYLTARDESHGRGWQQLFDTVTEACAYSYLKFIGCSNIAFIPRSEKEGVKTPDLEAILGSEKVLCEAKTINISKEEADRRKSLSGQTPVDRLEPSFFENKLKTIVERSKEQLENYDEDKEAKHIVFVALNFDDFCAYSKEDYCLQVRQYLEYLIPGIDIMFHDGVGAYHASFAAGLPYKQSGSVLLKKKEC